MKDECLIPTERMPLDEPLHSDGPGIYFIFLNSGISLEDFPVGESRLLYIGKAESAIAARHHAHYETSAQSTLRRSLGAILRRGRALFPDFSVLPRKSEGKITEKAIQSYRFTEESECILSDWMLKNLTFCYRIVKTGIRDLERCYIKKWNPILNLTHSKNSHRRTLEELRRQCRVEARKWTRKS
jgi:hypothetical protein